MGADLDAYVKRVVDAAPPLTPEQRCRIASLLRGPGTSVISVISEPMVVNLRG